MPLDLAGRDDTAVSSTTTLQKSSHPPKRPEHPTRMLGKISGNQIALIVSRSMPGATRAMARERALFSCREVP